MKAVILGGTAGMGRALSRRLGRWAQAKEEDAVAGAEPRVFVRVRGSPLVLGRGAVAGRPDALLLGRADGVGLSVFEVDALGPGREEATRGEALPVASAACAVGVEVLGAA